MPKLDYSVPYLLPTVEETKYISYNIRFLRIFYVAIESNQPFSWLKTVNIWRKSWMHFLIIGIFFSNLFTKNSQKKLFFADCYVVTLPEQLMGSNRWNVIDINVILWLCSFYATCWTIICPKLRILRILKISTHILVQVSDYAQKHF